MLGSELNNRFGIINVSFAALKASPLKILKIFNELLVIRAETMLHRKQIEYICASEKFDIIPDNAEPPLYNVKITTDPETKEIIDISFEKDL